MAMASPQLSEREVVLGLAILLPLLGLGLGFCRGGKPRAPRARTMSFGSGYMSVGSWPRDIKMSDPIITAFLFLDGVPKQAALEEACSKMLHYHNFSSLPVRRRWSYSTRFEWSDIEVQPSDLITWAKAAGSASVLAEMDRVKDAPLRQETADGRVLPMWGIHVIENTGEEEAGFGTVVALRVHHTLGDGMSMVAVARAVLEAVGGGQVGMASGGGDGGKSPADAVVKSANRGLLNFSAAEILRGIQQVIVLSVFAGPDSPLPFGHFEAPHTGGGAAAAHRPHEGWLFGVVKRGAFSGRRRTVMLPDIPLSLIKKIKDASATTVNDVVMTLVAGCARRYSEANGASSDSFGRAGFKSRGLLPVALPRQSPSSRGALCNKWAFVSMDLSVDEPDPASRLQKIKATTIALKRSPTAVLQYLFQTYAMPHLPLWVCREMVHGALAGHTVTVSNVPGPQEPVKFAGVGLKSVHFAYSNIMPQVGAVSLDGKMAINFVVDPLSVPDSHTLSTHFLDELDALAEGVGVGAEISGELSDVRTQATALAVVMEGALNAPAASS
eukprot:g6392.t1